MLTTGDNLFQDIDASLASRHGIQLLRLTPRLIGAKLHPHINLVIKPTPLTNGLIFRNIRRRWPWRSSRAVRILFIPESVSRVAIDGETVRRLFGIGICGVGVRVAVLVDGIVGRVGGERFEAHAAAVVEGAADEALGVERCDGCFDAVGQDGAA